MRWRAGFQHNAACTHADIIADVDRAQHLGSGTDQHIVAQSRVALAGILAGAAQRHTVIDCAVITDLCRLTKDDTHAVVDEKLAADFGTGVDLDAGQMPRQLADKAGQKKQR